MSSKSVIAWNPAYRVRLTEVSRITVTRITVQCAQLICRAFAGHALRAHAPTQIKTPPGIGRRFEEKCRGRWKQSYTETFRFSIPVAGVEPVDLAQQRRPYQRGRAQFLPVGVREQAGVL